jgi:hypothetical protein
VASGALKLPAWLIKAFPALLAPIAAASFFT